MVTLWCCLHTVCLGVEKLLPFLGPMLRIVLMLGKHLVV